MSESDDFDEDDEDEDLDLLDEDDIGFTENCSRTVRRKLARNLKPKERKSSVHGRRKRGRSFSDEESLSGEESDHDSDEDL
jgi:hypothetical protein